MIYEQTTLNCGGRLIDLSTPIIMGIINATPDSFYEGSRFELHQIDKVASQMLAEGATILDVGGASTRPGASSISIEEEISRVIPVIEKIKDNHPDAIISIDTTFSKVAAAALDAGASMINDISAWSFDPGLLDVVTERNVPYVLTHMQGKPADMQTAPTYDDVLVEVIDFLISRLGVLSEREVHDVIVDPGFGFGKSDKDNFTLLKNLGAFRIMEKPILMGLSRKSSIQRVLNIAPYETLNGTTALHMIALQQGARILRVHDVKPAAQCIELHLRLQSK